MDDRTASPDVYNVFVSLKSLTYKVAVEALTKVKHARSVRQRPGDIKRLTT